MDSLFSSIWRLLISRRLAVGLLIIISVMLFLGIVLPVLSHHTPEEMEVFRREQPLLYRLGSTFDPPALVGSWSFIILTTLLFTSTVLCAIERIRNREFSDPYAGTPEYFRTRITLAAEHRPETLIERAASLLKAGRWRHIETAAGPEKTTIMGEKGSFGFWGSIVFHLGFLIILAGAIISAGTRLNASLLITEGQSIQLSEEAFTTVSSRPDNLTLPPLGMKLSKVDAVWKEGIFPVDYTAFLRVTDKAGRTSSQRSKVNKALKVDGVTFILENFGYAPGFRAVDQSGQTVFEGFVNLKGREPGSKDSFEIPEKDLVIKTSFLPDKKDKQSLEPKNPVFYLKIDRAGEQIYEGVSEPGKPIRVGDLDLEFREMRRWVYFRVIRDRGVAVLFWGFVISFIGLVVRFFLHERTMKITVVERGRGSGIVVSGKSRYFPALFQEDIERMADNLVYTEKRVK